MVGGAKQTFRETNINTRLVFDMLLQGLDYSLTLSLMFTL